jgi:hypothetical protein
LAGHYSSSIGPEGKIHLLATDKINKYIHILRVCPFYAVEIVPLPLGGVLNGKKEIQCWPRAYIPAPEILGCSSSGIQNPEKGVTRTWTNQYTT